VKHSACVTTSCWVQARVWQSARVPAGGYNKGGGESFGIQPTLSLAACSSVWRLYMGGMSAHSPSSWKHIATSCVVILPLRCLSTMANTRRSSSVGRRRRDATRLACMPWRLGFSLQIQQSLSGETRKPNRFLSLHPDDAPTRCPSAVNPGKTVWSFNPPRTHANAGAAHTAWTLSVFSYLVRAHGGAVGARQRAAVASLVQTAVRLLLVHARTRPHRRQLALARCLAAVCSGRRPQRPVRARRLRVRAVRNRARVRRRAALVAPTRLPCAPPAFISFGTLRTVCVSTRVNVSMEGSIRER
jgi:hypothetical protein